MTRDKTLSMKYLWAVILRRRRRRRKKKKKKKGRWVGVEGYFMAKNSISEMDELITS